MSPPTIFDTFIVSTVTTEKQLPSKHIRKVSLIADPDNAAGTYIEVYGISGTGNPAYLKPGISMDIYIDDMRKIYYKGSAAGLILHVKWEA